MTSILNKWHLWWLLCLWNLQIKLYVVIIIISGALGIILVVVFSMMVLVVKMGKCAMHLFLCFFFLSMVHHTLVSDCMSHCLSIRCHQIQPLHIMSASISEISYNPLPRFWPSHDHSWLQNWPNALVVELLIWWYSTSNKLISLARLLCGSEKFWDLHLH